MKFSDSKNNKKSQPGKFPFSYVSVAVKPIFSFAQIILIINFKCFNCENDLKNNCKTINSDLERKCQVSEKLLRRQLIIRKTIDYLKLDSRQLFSFQSLQTFQRLHSITAASRSKIGESKLDQFTVTVY